MILAILPQLNVIIPEFRVGDELALVGQAAWLYVTHYEIYFSHLHRCSA